MFQYLFLLEMAHTVSVGVCFSQINPFLVYHLSLKSFEAKQEPQIHQQHTGEASQEDWVNLSLWLPCRAQEALPYFLPLLAHSLPYSLFCFLTLSPFRLSRRHLPCPLRGAALLLLEMGKERSRHFQTFATWSSTSYCYICTGHVREKSPAILTGWESSHTMFALGFTLPTI